jgi:hypothetical protein
MVKRFSERQGYRGNETDITVREDAPEDLRYALPQIAMNLGMVPKGVRETVCRTLLVSPDPNNWSPTNGCEEIDELLSECEWFKVYDVAEALYERLAHHSSLGDQFKADLNQFFREKVIGWELSENGIVYRGDEVFAAATHDAADVLAATGRSRTATEIHEALRDISRRPTADLTGAIHHAIAALECTARDVLGDSKGTLGVLLPKLDLPRPLDAAVEKLWGFASDKARHVREGDQLDHLQAELVVSVACSICIFLAKRTGAGSV